VNVDTAGAMRALARALGVRERAFGVAGTKDKRGVTLQHCTLYRKRPADFARLNQQQHQPLIRCGSFKYVSQPKRLGDLRGNQFGIVLRALDCDVPAVETACTALQQSGFINYFGLLRFGSGGAASHLIGGALLRGEWRAAVDLLYRPREGDRDQVARGKLLYAQGDYNAARCALPPAMAGERKVTVCVCVLSIFW
jgi:tRNA pseudouridine13 synthase